MRHVMYGMVCFAIAIYFLQIILVVDGYFARKTELDEGSLFAMKHTMEQLYDGNISSKEEAKEYFEHYIKDQITSNTELEVLVEEFLDKEGLIAIRVKENFYYANGKPGTLEIEKIGMIDYGFQEVAEE